MQKDPLVFLDEISFSITLIEQYTAGLSFNSFDESYDAQDKVLRRLEIIAEAAKRLLRKSDLKIHPFHGKASLGFETLLHMPMMK